MSQEWFFDFAPSPIRSPSPTRRKGYASPIFAIVPDHSNDSLHNQLRDQTSPITSRTTSPVRRNVVVSSPLASCSISRTSSASTPSLMRTGTPIVFPTNGTPGLGQRSRSAFARSVNDLFPTEPRSRSQSVVSPRPMTPDQRREKAREIVQQLKESSAGSRTQRALNRSETVSRLPRRQETASVLSTSTITRKDGKSGKIVSRCESTTSVTISKNYNNSSNAVAKKSPPAVIERSDKQILVNGKSKSAASYPIRKKSEATLSRSKVQLLSKPNDEGLTATPVRAQSTASNRSPSPVWASGSISL